MLATQPVDLLVDLLLAGRGRRDGHLEVLVAADLDGGPDFDHGLEGDRPLVLPVGDVDLGGHDGVDLVFTKGLRVVVGQRLAEGLLPSEPRAEPGFEDLAGPCRAGPGMRTSREMRRKASSTAELELVGVDLHRDLHLVVLGDSTEVFTVGRVYERPEVVLRGPIGRFRPPHGLQLDPVPDLPAGGPGPLLEPAPQARNVLLLVASYVFYSFWDWRFCGLLALTTAIDYFVGLALESTDDERRRKAYLAVSMAANLTILGFFKYFDFFADSAAELMRDFGLNPDPPRSRSSFGRDLLLRSSRCPTGSTCSVGACRRARDDRVRRRFVSFFPHLVAGPILRAPHHPPSRPTGPLRRPTRSSRRSPSSSSACSRRWSSPTRSPPYVNQAFDDADGAGSLTLLLGVVGFAIQIYSDFSGYTDIARGSAAAGLDLVLQLRAALPVAEHQRVLATVAHLAVGLAPRLPLHPLGGNQHGRWRTYLNLMTTMLLGGLWHGAA